METLNPEETMTPNFAVQVHGADVLLLRFDRKQAVKLGDYQLALDAAQMLNELTPEAADEQWRKFINPVPFVIETK